MKTPATLLALALLAASPAWAVYKCSTPDGRVRYQAEACPLAETGVQLHPQRRAIVVQPDPATYSPLKPNNQADPFAAAPAPVQAAPSTSPLEAEAQTCLAFVLPMLKDPGSPTVRDVRKEGTVLSMTVYAKNAYGGVAQQAAACEIKNGRLDVGWTHIHLKRLGWYSE